jgi:hypothetical protein
MQVVEIHISLIKLSKDRKLRLQELNNINLNAINPILSIDQNYLLIDNYEAYFKYLINSKSIVPVIIIEPDQNFYFNPSVNIAA